MKGKAPKQSGRKKTESPHFRLKGKQLVEATSPVEATSATPVVATSATLVAGIQPALTSCVSLAQKAGFSSAEARLWKFLNLPTLLMFLCFVANSVEAPRVMCIEYFAGVGMIAQGFIDQGFAALTYDNFHKGTLSDPTQDLNSNEGFIAALCWLLHMEPGGLVWLGTVCSSWILMAMGSTGRSISCVLGSQRLSGVQQANMMAIRSAMLALICYVRGTAFFEQPATSLMLELPCWKFIEQIAEHIDGWTFAKVRTCLGAFGAERPKPVILTGNREWLYRLARSTAGMSFPTCAASGVVRELGAGADGKRRFAGGPALKATQEYPKELGTQVHRMWQEHDMLEYVAHIEATYNPALLRQISESDVLNLRWELAELRQVLQWHESSARAPLEAAL